MAIGSFACGGTGPANNPLSAAPVAPNANSGDPLATKTAPPEATTNEAPTLTPVFKAYCDAWVKNDEAALKKVYSADTLKSFETQMKAEKAKSLMKFLEDDRVSGTPCEVRNEKITGDTAVAEIRANKFPNGIKVTFVKEKDGWKLTNKYPALDTGAKSDSAPAANSNAAPKSNSGK